MQLIERRQGNAQYKKKLFTRALQHYNKAASMLEAIKGRVAEEQQEVDANLGKVYLNIAAVNLQEQYYGEVIMWCSKALKLNGSNDKALLRRAKAHMGRHNYQVNLGPVGKCTSVQNFQCVNVYLLHSFDPALEDPTTLRFLVFITFCVCNLPDLALQIRCSFQQPIHMHARLTQPAWVSTGQTYLRSCNCPNSKVRTVVHFVLQSAVMDLTVLIQQDPANLDAHNLMQDARAAEYADSRKQ